MADRNLLAQAILADDLNTAVKLLMDALGISTGDVAAQAFSGSFQVYSPRWHSGTAAEAWAKATDPCQRAALLAKWLTAELANAVED